MKCSNCGGEISNDSNYCGKCGKRIDTYRRKPLKKRNLVLVICLFLILVSVGFVMQKQKFKISPYQYNTVEKTIDSCIAQITGNKNSIIVSDENKNMKTLAESMADDLFTQMKNGRKMEIPENECNIASKYSTVKSRKFVQIDYYENLNNSLTSEFQKAEVSDVYKSILLAVLGKVSDVESLSFAGVFHMEMEKKNDHQINNSIWILEYTDQLSIAVIFTENEEGVCMNAYPLYMENVQSFQNMLDQLFEKHEKFQ